MNAPVSIDGGSLLCGSARIPVTDGVARFRTDDGYAKSFALQWHSFRTTQYDRSTRTSLTGERYLRETGWPATGLAGELILEAGCGAGRFTEILAATGGSILAIDFSSAVDVAAEQNRDCVNVAFAQADILDLPYPDGVFDRVFCHGVLQHTPDPAVAFRSLHRVLRPGGRMSIDVYAKDGRIRPWKSKYLWRPITTRMDPDRLLAFLRWFIPKWLPFDTVIKRTPVLGTYVGAIVPCWNYFYTDLPHPQKVEWAVLDTFDALSATYDLPVRLGEVRHWFDSLGYRDVEVREGGNGIVGNAVKGE
ncbi:MAG: class I SAM-dependent methyltransferase [Acetobacterales bacterium]